MRHAIGLIAVVAFGSIELGSAFAQASTGTITGRIADSTGAVVQGAQVEVTNSGSGFKRKALTTGGGIYSVAALPPGDYEVVVTAAGLREALREAIIEAGTTTTADFSLQIGPVAETVTADTAVPEILNNAYEISGVTTRPQIDGLPLNGRDFLELAKLEPGALQPTRGSNNRVFVPLLGSPSGGNKGSRTLVTVDGGSIMQIGNGGSAMGFSQEAVQEFQVSTVNFDLSTGPTASGAVNVVTRSGGNQWHGSGFYFFRDNVLSAYPGLKRDIFNPDPFFQRQQYGFSIGGPIAKNRLFVFGAVERNDQRGVVNTEILTPEFASFSRITASPTYIDQIDVRVDWEINQKHAGFFRQSHEGGFAFAPTTLNGVGQLAYPSAWTTQPEWTDQSVLGVTSQLIPTVVNDFRFSYFFVSSAEQAPTATNCPGCLGIGAPSINVADLFIGTSSTATVLGRRYDLNDIATLLKQSHQIRFGVDWEITRGGRTDIDDQPVTMDLFSPEDVENYNALHPPEDRLPLPASFPGLNEILQLPLEDFTVGIGNPKVPQANSGTTRVSPLVHLFVQDTWRIRPNFTLIYGLGWTFGAPLNYDLRKPAYLLPVLGNAGLPPTHKNWEDFSPAAGFAWRLNAKGKFLIRGGVGVYYDQTSPFDVADNERVSLGPRGVGRGSYVGAGIPNPLPYVPGVPEGSLLYFPNPTSFTGAFLLNALSTIRADLEQTRGDPNNTDFSITNIQVDKQGSITDTHLPDTSAIHGGIGLQWEVAPNFVINADVVIRSFRHVSGSYPGQVDLNHFFSARGPTLPPCSDSDRDNPLADCSLGPINQTTAIGSARYEGILVRAEKHLANRWQLLCSYVYSSDLGTNFDVGFDNDHPLASYGPLASSPSQILNLSGIVQLRGKFQVGFFATYVSRPPFSAYLGGIDLNGDGTTDDLLPGTTVNEFDHGLGKKGLRTLVDQFNKTYAGGQDAHGTFIPLVALPKKFEFGDPLFTQDLRVSREFSLPAKMNLILIGEVFNVLNIANLSGRSGDLLSSGFGAPRSRVTQVFGSGGPRAFQFAMRLSF